jgi:hypothetical protein
MILSLTCGFDKIISSTLLNKSVSQIELEASISYITGLCKTCKIVPLSILEALHFMQDPKFFVPIFASILISNFTVSIPHFVLNSVIEFITNERASDLYSFLPFILEKSPKFNKVFFSVITHPISAMNDTKFCNTDLIIYLLCTWSGLLSFGINNSF